MTRPDPVASSAPAPATAAPVTVTATTTAAAPASPTAARPRIAARKVRFDFAAVPRHWFGGSKVATHLANGVNMLFPQGERFFVRSVNHFLDRIDDPELVAQARGFFGQEGKHASAHDDYNDMLRAQGYQIDRFLAAYAWWGREVTERIMPPELRLATTAAAEHFTAIMAENAFKKQILAAAHPTMKSLLQWHAAEEIEHKSVAFDVLQRVNPSYALRLAGMVVATVQLSSWWMLGTLTLLRQERLSLAELRAERDGIRATRPDDEGIARRVFLRGIREYLRRDFHPADNDNFHLAELLLRDSGVVAASA
ncbi:MAG: metal-dependent hydrolase [Kofleriaceae bacterium]|nr:metal-dependent hydrolase [Myxococcales bacterium]MCB9562987.1 metal-dependent hydrolase [Kofleriaceae bacterium]